MLAKALHQRRQTLGAHTIGTESIVDHMDDDRMMVQGLSPARFFMLAIFCVAIYINEVPLFSDFRTVLSTGSYIEYFLFFPLFYTSIHWLEEVGMYQTMLFAMVFQSLSVLVSKTANDNATGASQELVGEVLSAIAQVYIFNGITKFTGTWFDNKARPVATAVIILFSHLATYTPAWIQRWHNTWTWQQQIEKDLFDVFDEFRLVLFILNIILTIVIIAFFESKPKDYPTLSQQYHRSKMYEPHLDVKYLLQYKDFKLYAVVCGFLLTAINVAQAVPFQFLFVEAQASDAVQDITYVYGPLIFIAGLVVSALILSNFNQTNEDYKRYLLLLIVCFASSTVLIMFAFMSKSAGFYAFALIISDAVCGAFKLYLFEFMTEIIFPVSPVFALAILHSMSGLLSLLVSMLADDIVRKDPTNNFFVFIIQVLCLVICGIAIFVFMTKPFKLNRTDYDTGRRSTMITSYMKKQPSKKGDDEEATAKNTSLNSEFNANSINSLLDEQQKLYQ